MKALTDRLEMLRLAILDENGGITDPAARQDALDIWIEANAIAEALPDITIAIPPRPPRAKFKTVGVPPGGVVVNGGRSQ